MLFLNSSIRQNNFRQVLLTTLSSYTFKRRNTIFALSSGQGKCGVAVIRVSGPEAGTALKKLTAAQCLPRPRTAVLREIVNPIDKEILDKALVLWFPGPKSFTGENSCEFQVHGGHAVVNSVLSALQCTGLRPAEAGEFTKRAFLNGKLDLTEVEGLADLIAAETEFQRKQAYLQSEGILSNMYNSWRDILIKSLAHVEAHIDFEETEEFDEQILQNIFADIRKLKAEISRHLEDGCKGERLRNGVKAVIIGETNAGKSSFFNILCKKPASIVTPIEGTTRDVIEINVDINGYPVILTDTAGLRSETKDIVEQEGIQRAIFQINQADLLIYMVDIEKLLNSGCKTVKEYIDRINEFKIKHSHSKETIIILNKIDLIHKRKDRMSDLLDKENCLLVSCKDKDGFSAVTNKLTEKLRSLCLNPNKEHPSMTHIRHRKHLTDCLTFLENFEEEINTAHVVLFAENLRQAVYHLGQLTGRVTNEQILDIIFKDFCIGK
ncbi:tRNA modification GTPase GTPBP3, mitochondrial [Agrilus planipennis]|uniref:tRNA modification GTPase GTPBP3, mitochondrial n=1 Tax=Agrilus planipennis TaxID=224129 RepID=A0A1W4X9U1_AGRPL|nr:tRNA modification GTPase GTPBP3, mitochondrial [Agrilus planipennis]